MPMGQMWRSMVVPKPYEQCSAEAVKGVTGSEVDAAAPVLEPRLKRSPVGGRTDDGPGEWEVGDIILFLPEERVRIRDSGVCMLTIVHMVLGTKNEVEEENRDEERAQ